MPAAVWVPAAASLVGSVGSAALGARASNRATRVQAQAQQAALAAEQQREQREREEREEERRLLQQAWEERQARRDAILRRYGVTPTSRTMPPGWTPGTSAGAPRTAGVPRVSVDPSQSMGMGQEPLTPPLVPPRNPWGDWGI